jgi:hypothetical protein
MGLFDSKTTYTAHVGSSSLIAEEERENTVKSMLLQSTISSLTTSAESIRLGLGIDMYARGRSLIKYAKRPDGYYYGLPEATHFVHPNRPEEGEYLPIAVLMHDKVWFDEEVPGDDEDPLQKTTTRLLKKLAIDALEVKEDYLTTVEEAIASGERPGEKKLSEWDFFIHFAVPIHSRIRGSREYIFHYLKFLKDNSTWVDRTDYLNWIANPGSELNFNNFHLSEGEGSNKDWQIAATGYEVYYGWSYIDNVVKSGQYTPPGWDVPLKPNRMYSKIYQFGDADYAEGIHEVHGPDAIVATSEPEGQYHDYAVFTKQYVDESGVMSYEQVIIMSPSQYYVINTPTDDGTEEIQYVRVELFPEDPEEDSEFRWPIHWSSLQQVRRLHREEALQDAVCGTVFLVEKIQVKWYQKSFFKWLIIIIVIIVIIITWQYELLPTVYGMAAAAFAAGSFGTAIALAALYVAMTFALGFIISFAGSLIGGTWGKIFVILAMAYLAGGANMFTNIGQSFTQMSTSFGWGSATGFLQSIGPVLSIAQVVVEDVAMRRLDSKMEKLEMTAKEKYEELKDAWDSFGPVPQGVDPLDLKAAFNAQWYVEQPENYFARTLNANPGVLGYDVVNKFADLALAIPENGNPGDFIQGIFSDMEKQRGAV